MKEKIKRLLLIASVLSLTLLCACGHKGPLKLPETDIYFKGSFNERS